MSDESPGCGDEGEEDCIRLAPAVFPLLAPDVSASVFSAVVNLLAELRVDAVPPLAQPVPGRPGWYSAPLARDIGLAEYYVGDTEPGAEGPDIYVARIVISDDWPDF
ncbi:hypothetical protein AB0I22_35605 [Streptomyces sp. NPDC050610]|uniref:hypothetical protein n=1 Tax=Streptomyces sp. NPDC050610 TaxID=3157097 RepID=UPI00341BDE36